MPKLSVIIPVFNEHKILESVFSRLFESACPIEREWIVVDDCSTDRSAELLRNLRSKYRFQLIEHQENLGKGRAIQTGLAQATGDIIVIQDADFEYDPEDVPALLQPIVDGEADAVYGSRFKHNAPQVHRTYHYFVNRILTLLSNLMSGIYLTDMETCYKLFRADLIHAMNLRSQRFGIEVELTAYLAKTSARVFELPIRYYPRTHLQGKKINWKDGFAALWHLLRYNYFTPPEEAFTNLPQKYR